MNDAWETTELSQRIPIGNHMQMRIDGYRDAHEVMFWRWQLAVILPRSSPMEIAAGDLRNATSPETARVEALEACGAWFGDVTGSLANAYGHQVSPCIDAPVSDFAVGDDAGSPWIVFQHVEMLRRGPFTLTLQAETEHYLHGGKNAEVKSWYLRLTHLGRGANCVHLELGVERMTWRPLPEAREAAKVWARALMEAFRNPFEDGADPSEPAPQEST